MVAAGNILPIAAMTAFWRTKDARSSAARKAKTRLHRPVHPGTDGAFQSFNGLAGADVRHVDPPSASPISHDNLAAQE